MADRVERRTGNPVSRWWKTLSTRARERVILGATVAGALAARDLVLLGGAALTMGALEIADWLTGSAKPQPARAG